MFRRTGNLVATQWRQRAKDGPDSGVAAAGIKREDQRCFKLARTTDVRKEKGTKPWLLCQQALLQLLVMNHEQERKQLCRLLSGVSLEDLQDPDCDLPENTDCQERAALRNGCIKRLKSIHTDLQSHNKSPAVPQPEIQGQRATEPWPQQQLEECYLVLLVQLSELQETEDWEVLSALVDGVSQRSSSVWFKGSIVTHGELCVF